MAKAKKVQPISLGDIWKDSPDILNSSVDISEWAFDNIGIDLYDNQIEFAEAITDFKKDNVIILGSRGGGKTMAVSCAIVKLCVENPNFRVGVFAPKWSQATRVIKEILPYLLVDSCKIKKDIDEKNTVKAALRFKNGSFISCISANDLANIEGEHFHLVVIDEAHLVPSVSVSQKIAPMLGSYNVAKTVKLGVAMYDNHFYKSFLSPNYHKVIKTWTECPILLSAGSIMIDGKEYPRKAFNNMPLLLKKQMFPDHPELHVQGDGDMDEVDFLTNYMVQWVKDLSNFLSEQEQEKLLGYHHMEEKGQGNEVYVFGLDFGQGSPTGNDAKLDFTALAVWKVVGEGIKHKVWGKKWKGNPLMQIAEIIDLIHPKNGLFPCRVGMCDYSGVGAVAVGAMQQAGIQVTGIMFQQTEKESGKNFKNAIFDNFKYELSNDRVKYPSLIEQKKNPDMADGYSEWCHLERRQSMGFNKKIEAAEGYHDDICCCDSMGIFIANRADVMMLHGSHRINMENLIQPMPSLKNNCTVNPFMGRFGGLR